MTRKKVILLAIGATAIGAGARHCMKAMAPSCAKGEAIDLCSRKGRRACGSDERAEEACSETAALAA